MDDAKPNKTSPENANVGGPSGLRTPAKGDSSGGDIPREKGSAGKNPSTSQPAPENSAGDATFVDASPSATPGRARQSSAAPNRDHLQPGDVLGNRYEIWNVLGEGGMGTVYKALDREVDHLVALKLIRPDMAANPVILARFKQELLTARQVTHRNVIRIYDLSEVDGVKFITMEFVEGCDLHKLLRDDGKLAPDRAVEIMRQVCLALEAAHAVGIIHRDLKPQNIMQDKQGRILVMDFGLARSLESGGMTQSGALLGTIEYMSPQQAMGAHLDGRSDIFSLGLIFYELLTGKMPYKADTAMASLLKRNQERAVPAADLDATIPKVLSDIVGKCLERDLSARYQNAKEILSDLDAWEGKQPTLASVTTPIPVPPREVPWKWIAGGTLAVAVVIGGLLFSGKLTSKPPAPKAVAGPQVSLAILPFRNGSGDAQLDWLGSTLAGMLSTEVGQSAQLRTISSDRLHQVLSDLKISPGSDIDPTTMGRIAEFSNADTVVSGQYAKFDGKIRIDATVRDLKHQHTIPVKAEADNEKALVPAISQLAQTIQQSLSLSSDVLQELRAKSFRPSSNSLPGQTYSSLRNDDKAKEYSQKAVDLSDKLPAPERYLIQANYAQVTNDFRKAIESYENLEKVSPEDPDVRVHLAELYESTGAFDKARPELAKVLASDPKHGEALLAAGRVEIKSGNPQGSLDYLNRGLTLAIQVGNADGKATILNAIGAAYEQLGKPDDAMRNYQESLSTKQTLGQKPGIALTLGNIARVQATLGKPEEALKSYQGAVKLQREIGDKKGLGVTLLNFGELYGERGRYDDALTAYKESLQIHRDVGDENRQALCLNNIGNIYLAKGQPSDALTYY